MIELPADLLAGLVTFGILSLTSLVIALAPEDQE